MTLLGDFIGGGSGFGFGSPETVERLRATEVIDRYTKKPVRQDWTRPDVITIENASIASIGQTQADDTQRRNVDVSALLTITDPHADVMLGDRIRQGSRVWEVVEFPENDRNPFSGWQPTLVVALKEANG